ncbi:MAG TPA: hypothetical protein VMF89_12965 [Polyangiales bacterium]|nr:hypothetical protein [Polyangiales bacterium]
MAKDLGIDWSDGGQGIYLHEPEQDATVWRVHSEFAGAGAIVDIEPATGRVVRIEEAYFERRQRAPIPLERRPSEQEAVAFLKEKAERVGWPWPDSVAASWDEEGGMWRLASASAPAGHGLAAEVRGMRGRLYLSKLWRV